MENAYTGDRFRGEGPGVQTPDGSSVELYRRLPYFGEVDFLEPWITGPKLLELGCGVGRLTKHLLMHGFEVTAVDNSPEMLQFVPRDAVIVCSNIEDLELDVRFDSAILASNLINIPSTSQRSAILESCQRHLRADGALLFERYDPNWLDTVAVGPAGELGEVHVHIDRVERQPDYVEMSLRFRAGAQQWLHHFAVVSLSDAQIHAALAQAGFETPKWINRRWGRAIKNAG